MNTINHLDLFSGVGGFSLGLKEAGVHVGWHGFSDIDKFANNVFRERFPNAEELGSIEDIDIDRLPRIDLVTFGFPCQDLSIAGKRKGFDGSRSSLYFKAIEIIERKKPKYFVFENVKGFFSSNAGKDFTIALKTIADIGYDGQWQLLNTRWFLPQNRERIYFVGHIRGECRPKVFPVRENVKKINKGIEKAQARIIDPNYLKQDFRVYEGFSPTINARDHKDPKLVQVHIKEATKKGYAIAEKGDSINLSQPKSKTRRGRVGKGVAQTLDTGMQQYTIQSKQIDVADYRNDEGLRIRKDGKSPCLSARRRSESDLSTMPPIVIHNTMPTGIRRLTPTECERLQGFPDGWTEGQSDTQRYKQMGNAVSVPVVKAVMERLYR